MLDSVPAEVLPAARAPESAPVDLSVVIPAFNEQSRIGPSIEGICAYLSTLGRTWEVIVVDDGSTDGTATTVQERIDLDPRVRMIRLGRRGGKGQALRIGVLNSRGTDILISDADMSTPISEVEKLWAARRDAVVAIGSRALPASDIEVRQNLLRRIVGRLGNRYIQTVAVPGIRDTQCGFKLLRGRPARALMAQTRLNGWGIDVEMLHLCTRFGWPVVEVPVRWGHRPGSKLRPADYLRVLVEVVYVRLVHRHAWVAAR